MRSKVIVFAAGHTDAARATLAFPEYLSLHRASKVAISLDGNGPACLKDAEMFAQGTFVLRQRSESSSISPLAPQNGKHWMLFEPNSLEGHLDCFVNRDDQRE